MVQSKDFYTLYQDTYTKYTEQYGKLVCVFLKKGSFYEFYGQEHPETQQQLNTAKEVLELFGIVIHVYPNEGPNGTTGYFGGVPEYTLDKWAGKLTKLGWTVVVIDEFKNGAGKVTKRDVSKVLSPGTHIESAEAIHSFFLTSLWMELDIDAPTFGVASADLTTGQVYLYEGKATGSSSLWHTDDLRHFFQVYPPKELVLYVRGGVLEQSEESLRRTLYLPTQPIHIREGSPQTQGALESVSTRETFLRDFFNPKSALPLRTWLHCSSDGSSLRERALCCLLRFAEDHAPSLASLLQSPTLWHPKENLQIINNALSQLNLVKLPGSDQPCVEDLIATPVTIMGKRSLSSYICTPLTNKSKIEERQSQIQWILESSPTMLKELQATLSLVFDLQRIHRTILRGALKAADIVQYHQSIVSLQYCIDLVKEIPSSNSPLVFKESLQKMIHSLETEVDIEKARLAIDNRDDLGFLSAQAGPETLKAENGCKLILEKANEWLSKLLITTGVSKEAVYFKPSETSQFLVHATKSATKQIQDFLKKQPIHDYTKLSIKSMSSNARIEHPYLEMLQADIDAARLRLVRCLAKEVPEVCIRYTTATRELWQPLEEWVIQLDITLSMAKTAKQQGWVKPFLEEGEQSKLSIENLRHPLIENQKRTSQYVTHNVQLGTPGAGNGWLLYGMNASGKSSLMKSIGLAVLLAQIGSYVPATKMTLVPFYKIATRILNQDNLWAGLSSFAVEMSELRDIFQVADEYTLVLGDELCAGTESISATSIVAAGIEWLHKANARFVLATHLHDLMRLDTITNLSALRIWHLHVEYDRVKDLLIYHRTLRPGPGSSMYGLEVAKALHLPFDLIESAFVFRRILTNTTSIESASSSSYNSETKRNICTLCKSPVNLEVHHISPQKDSIQQRNADGTDLNHIRNLITLCQACHDKEHSGQVHIGQVQDTSEGPIRPIQDLSQYMYTPKKEQSESSKKSDFTDEDLHAIKETRTIFHSLHPKLLSYQIMKDHGIVVSERQLKSLIQKGILN